MSEQILINICAPRVHACELDLQQSLGFTADNLWQNNGQLEVCSKCPELIQYSGPFSTFGLLYLILSTSEVDPQIRGLRYFSSPAPTPNIHPSLSFFPSSYHSHRPPVSVGLEYGSVDRTELKGKAAGGCPGSYSRRNSLSHTTSTCPIIQ